MPVFLDHNDFCENLPEVTSTKIFARKKFHPEGLFSEQIFGPIQNYTCQCGTYFGPSMEGSKCDLCGVQILESRVRREKFAKIVLPIQIINPIFYDMLKEIGKSSVITPLEELLKNESSVLYKNEQGYYVIDSDENAPIGSHKWDRLDAVYELVRGISEKYKEKDERWKNIYENIDKLLINEIIVLPPELRPSSSKASINELDEINRYYMQILTKKEVMDQTLINIQRDKSLFYQYFRQVQKNVNDLYEQILDKLSKKEGLIRGHILGKRIDFSARGVIAPGPALSIDECSLPYTMFLELFKLDISKKLIELGKFKLLNNAVDFVEECIKYEKPVLFDLCKQMLQENNEVCLMNRQPSLHRLSILGFYIDIALEHVIRMHPLSCPAFNLDHDGDTMACYIPVTSETKEEIKEKFLMSRNFINPANDSLISTPSQDMVLGIYSLTNCLFPNLQNKVECKGSKIVESRKIFNDCLPEDFRLIDKPVGKKTLLNILEEIKDNYSEEVCKNVLDSIKRVGFKYSTLLGTTMSLEHFKLEGEEEIRNEIYDLPTIQEQLKKVQSEELTEELRNQFYYSFMIESGARGNWDQVKQVILTRGFISNFKGKILEDPIKGNLINGLNEDEFFNSTYGCRKGLLDVALNTGASGYLSRKLVMSMANLQLDYNIEDCGTNDTLKVYVEDDHKAKMLVKRNYVENGEIKKITKENYKDFVGKNVYLRSPLYCKNDKLCKTCYGDFDVESRFVGVISAQSLGERGTQLVLRSFHTSLRKDTEILDVNKNSYQINEVYDLVKSGENFYTFSCSPEGKIEVSKVIDAHKDRFEKKIVRVTLDNGEKVDCTLDHEWIMRDGTHKEAKDLVIGDSIMPIYSGKEISWYKGYKTIRQNTENKFAPNEDKKYRSDLVFQLASEHPDTKISENPNNDYPTNIMLVNESEHLTLHNSDAIYSPSRINVRRAVSKSNRRRTKDPEWVRKFNEISNNHKITNVEFIELDEYEEFYDLTVDSEYHNFALASGVFIHNSGVAATGDSDDMKQQDIVTGLSRVTKLLHSEVKDYHYEELIKHLFNIYRESGDILHIHFECLVSQLLWKGDYKWRTLENRDQIEPEHFSIQTVPEKESWLLALAFSNPRKSILKGILHSGKYKGIFDQILCGEKLDQ